MYSVSSGFTATAAQANAKWKRRFTLGGSDYTSRVMKWPKVTSKWNDLKPATVTIELGNDDKLFNFFLSNPASLRNSGTVELGFEYAVGSEEFVTLYLGTVNAVAMHEGSCKITLADKFKLLSDRIIGDSSTPASYTDSSYLVHDLTWYFCTSHGGLSAIQSTSNPDIDWSSFTSWSGIWSGDNVRMKAYIPGKKITEMLKRISEMTQSAIRVENNRLKFSRYVLTDSVSATLDDDTVSDMSLLIDERQLVNSVKVSADYNISSELFTITTTEVNTASINSFGIKEMILNGSDVWFVDSVSAINNSQRILQQYAQPYGRMTIQSALSGAATSVGDTITFTDDFYGLSGLYRIMGEIIDLETGVKTYEIDDTQILSSFRLDFSALDSTDLLL